MEGLDFVAFFAEDAGGGDVGGGADGGEIAAESGAREQTEIEHHALPRAQSHACGYARYDGEHRGDVGDVVDEGGDEHGRPHEEGVQREDVAAARLDEDIGDVVDDADGIQPSDDEEYPREEEQGLEIYLFQGVFDPRKVLAADDGVYHADDHETDADDAGSDIGLVGDKGGADEEGEHRDEEEGGEEVLDLGALGVLYLLLVLAEDEEEIYGGGESGDLDYPEHTHFCRHANLPSYPTLTAQTGPHIPPPRE